jgi:hypothetical protein
MGAVVAEVRTQKAQSNGGRLRYNTKAVELINAIYIACTVTDDGIPLFQDHHLAS